jgi:hypothetical protein
MKSGRQRKANPRNVVSARSGRRRRRKEDPTLSSSCIDVAFIKEKRSKSFSRSTPDPDINHGRSVSRARQIDVPQLPFKDKSLSDKEDKIASSTLKGRQASFHDSSKHEHEGRRQEEEMNLLWKNKLEINMSPAILTLSVLTLRM